MKISDLPEIIRESLTKVEGEGKVAHCKEYSQHDCIGIVFLNGYALRIYPPGHDMTKDPVAKGWYVLQSAHSTISMNHFPKFHDPDLGRPFGHSSEGDVAQYVETVANYPGHLGAIHKKPGEKS